MYKFTELDRVFQVLKQMGFDHEEEHVGEACFKDWEKKIDPNDYVKVLAYMIRAVLVDEVMKFAERLDNEECDMRDILLALVAKGMGVGYQISHMVEAAERGLRAFYEEGEYDALDLCFGVMLKDWEEKMSEFEKGREGMLQ